MSRTPGISFICIDGRSLPVGVDHKLLAEERVIFGRVKPAVARGVIKGQFAEQEAAIVRIQVDAEKIGIARSVDKLFGILNHLLQLCRFFHMDIGQTGIIRIAKRQQLPILAVQVYVVAMAVGLPVEVILNEADAAIEHIELDVVEPAAVFVLYVLFDDDARLDIFILPLAVQTIIIELEPFFYFLLCGCGVKSGLVATYHDTAGIMIGLDDELLRQGGKVYIVKAVIYAEQRDDKTKWTDRNLYEPLT